MPEKIISCSIHAVLDTNIIFFKMFTHLHLHTQYSLLEGAIRIKDLAAALKEKGYESCAITDHDNMFGAIEFYHAMKAANLKPIILSLIHI